MTIREQDWPAQRPPTDFAVSTVDAMLAPIRLVRTSKRRRPVVLIYWVLAALFASGSALGWTWSRYHRTPPPARIASIPPLAVPNTLARTPSVAGRVTAPRPLAIALTKPKVKSQGTIEPRPVATQPPPQLRTPACQCERGFADFICDCY